MQFSPISHHFISLWSKYCLQHRVLKHTQSVLLSSCQEIKFHTHTEKNHRHKIIVLYILMFTFYTADEKMEGSGSKCTVIVNCFSNLARIKDLTAVTELYFCQGCDIM
jgi:hypothetical protein